MKKLIAETEKRLERFREMLTDAQARLDNERGQQNKHKSPPSTYPNPHGIAHKQIEVFEKMIADAEELIADPEKLMAYTKQRLETYREKLAELRKK
jgi:chromosome segregation ATPase